MRLARELQSLGLSPHLVVRDSALADLGVPLLIEDSGLPRHPLAGVVHALRTWPELLVVPCDLPKMPAAGLTRMLASPAPSVAWDGRAIHPLVARINRRSLAKAASLLHSQGPVRALMSGAARVSLPAPWLENLNVPPQPG